MNHFKPGVLLGGLVLVLAAGCQNKLADENVALHRQNRELQERLSTTDAQLQQAPRPEQIQQLQGEIAQRDAQIAQLQTQLRTPAAGNSADDNAGLEGIEVTRDDRAGTVTVNVPGDVLFASGQAEVKDSARQTLTRIATAIKKDYAGKRLFVDGHTDADPITKTKDKWEDNLDLSAARARNVGKFLASQGIDSKLIGERAFGETAPRGSKSASRRVEIVVKVR